MHCRKVTAGKSLEHIPSTQAYALQDLASKELAPQRP